MLASPAAPVSPEHPRVRRVVRRPAAAVPPAAPPPPDPELLLRPAAACPRCGARPAMRVTAALVHALRDRPAHERVATYQCQRRGCGAVYDLTADAYLRAA
ncbi:MAG TPA: hypothetical protein VGO40_06690 [Longimicrobium sp.]|nr:hypothetical protein [Longimicrobium sp.]